MDLGNACLFSKKPEDMRRIGALGEVKGSQLHNTIVNLRN
jgi:hypothetical protein